MDLSDPKVIRVIVITGIVLVIINVLAVFINQTFTEIRKHWSLIKP
jgi:hypothetical protein